MATTTTPVFTAANVAVLMITGSKPRFELHVDGELRNTVPATRAWKSEQKAVIEAAQKLVVEAPVALVAQLLAENGNRVLQASEKPSRKLVVFAITTEGATAIVKAVGGKNAAERADALECVVDALLFPGLELERRGDALALTIAAPAAA